MQPADKGTPRFHVSRQPRSHTGPVLAGVPVPSPASARRSGGLQADLVGLRGQIGMARVLRVPRPRLRDGAVQRQGKRLLRVRDLRLASALHLHRRSATPADGVARTSAHRHPALRQMVAPALARRGRLQRHVPD